MIKDQFWNELYPKLPTSPIVVENGPSKSSKKANNLKKRSNAKDFATGKKTSEVGVLIADEPFNYFPPNVRRGSIFDVLSTAFRN